MLGTLDAGCKQSVCRYGSGMGIDFGTFTASLPETGLIEGLRTSNCYTQGG